MKIEINKQLAGIRTITCKEDAENLRVGELILIGETGLSPSMVIEKTREGFSCLEHFKITGDIVRVNVKYRNNQDMSNKILGVQIPGLHLDDNYFLNGDEYNHAYQKLKSAEVIVE